MQNCNLVPAVLRRVTNLLVNLDWICAKFQNQVYFCVFLELYVVNVTWPWIWVPRANIACDQSTGIKEKEEEFFFR